MVKCLGIKMSTKELTNYTHSRIIFLVERKMLYKVTQLNKWFDAQEEILSLMVILGQSLNLVTWSLEFNPSSTSKKYLSLWHDKLTTTIINGSQEAKVNINLHYSSCGRVTNAGIHGRLQAKQTCRLRR